MALRQLMSFSEIATCVHTGFKGSQSRLLTQNVNKYNSCLMRTWKSRPHHQQNSRFSLTSRRFQDASSRKGFSPVDFQNIRIDTGGLHSSRLFKPFIFTVMFSTGSLAGCAIWEYESIRARAMRHIKSSAGYNWFKDKLYTQKKRVKSLTEQLQYYWNILTPGEKIFAPICALNLIVFGLWRVPRLQNTMIRYFCSNPAAKALCWPMVLSTFSHYSFFHIFANMYVLHSFANAAVASLGKEQFLGLYLSAGVISSFASYLHKVLIGQAGLSLGASGAIMGILAYVCVQYPDTQLSIILLPMVTFSAGTAIKVLMGVDLMGCILGWKFFDHAAHLGGALCGVFWSYIGVQHIWPKREHLLRYWHEIRTAK